jgi:hypothetical protein
LWLGFKLRTPIVGKRHLGIVLSEHTDEDGAIVFVARASQVG